jgi:hypothetical protein
VIAILYHSSRLTGPIDYLPLGTTSSEMSEHPAAAPEYPPQHPNHGQPYYVVHDHDVLSGRGVNIASHPGNERFRSLVNKRYDANYCTSFSTSEKRALAVEIVSHIQSLDPPGRFLKRAGRSTSSRGLQGPWEELSRNDCIRKACQALRDCNRNDRSGYAASIAVPEDVQQEAAERSESGLSLKAHAAVVAAQSNLLLGAKEGTTSKPSSAAAIAAAAKAACAVHDRNSLSKRFNDDITADADAAETYDDLYHNEAGWLKRQRTDDPVLGNRNEASMAISFDDGQGVENGASGRPRSDGHITPPAPAHHMTAVPVTNTPMMHPYQMHHQHDVGIGLMDRSDALGSVGNPPGVPASPSYSVTANSGGVANAPYSPVAWNQRHLDDDEDEVDMGDWKPHPYDPDGDHHQPVDDVLQSAAVASLTNDIPEGDYRLLNGDHAPHRSLNLSELE